MYSSRKMTSLLNAASFHVDEITYCNFALPTQNKQTRLVRNRWHTFAQLAFPTSGNVNIFLARKNITGVTPLRIEWDVKKYLKSVSVTSQDRR